MSSFLNNTNKLVFTDGLHFKRREWSLSWNRAFAIQLWLGNALSLPPFRVFSSLESWNRGWRVLTREGKLDKRCLMTQLLCCRSPVITVLANAVHFYFFIQVFIQGYFFLSLRFWQALPHKNCEEGFGFVSSNYSVMFQHCLSNSLQYTYLFYFFLL